MTTKTKVILGALIAGTGLYLLYNSKQKPKANFGGTYRRKQSSKGFVNAIGNRNMQRASSSDNPACDRCQQESNSRCNSGKSFVFDGYQNCKCDGCVPQRMVKASFANASGNFFNVKTTNW